MIGSLIGGLFGLAGSAINAANQYGVNAQNQKYTQENMRLQNVLNKDEKSFQDNLNRSYQDFLWNNQYSKEMGGMKSVGLNPALANGSSIGGMSASNNVSAGPSGPASHGQMADLASPIAQGAQLGMEYTRQQLEGREQNNRDKIATAQEKYYNALTKKTEEDTVGQGLQNEQQYRYLMANGVEASVAKIWSECDLNAAKTKEAEQHVLNLCQELEVSKANVEYIRASTAKVIQEQREIKARIGAIAYQNAYHQALTYLSNEQAKTEGSKRENMQANTQLTNNQNRQQVEETRFYINSYDSRMEGIQLSNDAQEIANSLGNYQVEVNSYKNPKVEGRSHNVQQFFAPIGSLVGAGASAAGGFYLGQKGLNMAK